MSKIVGFFMDKTGNPSMMRLLCFLSFFPASYVMVRINTAEALMWYVGAYVLGYVGGNAGDALRKGGKVEDVDCADK